MKALTYTEVLDYIESPEIFQRFGFDKRGRVLVVDGIVGPATRSATYYLPEDTSKLHVIKAYEEILAGAQEERNNQGKFVKKYAPLWAYKKKPAWCAWFASWCLSFLNLDQPYKGNAKRLCRAVAKSGDMIENGSSVRAGDLMCWDRGTRAVFGHVGIVCGIDEDYIYVIEGNVGKRGVVRIFRYDRDLPNRNNDAFLFAARPKTIEQDIACYHLVKKLTK